MNEIRIDALLPAEMAERAEYIGVRKAEMPLSKMFVLAVLAGAFIALGAIFATLVGSGAFIMRSAEGQIVSITLPYGLQRLFMGLVFSLGLILVVIGGAELFTGNNLIVMAWANRKISTKALLRNWGIVYLGNFVGALGTAMLNFLARQYLASQGEVGITALKIAIAKTQLDFWQALFLGILCNGLVCLAVWMTYSARSVVDKIFAIIPPISAFVAAGYEHSIANMYFVPYAWLIKTFDPEFVQKVAEKVPGVEHLSWQNFLLHNLLPVTIGNVIGGAVLVALVYWLIFLRKNSQ
ncbi:MAG: formate transporter FocA [Chloroflexi bacterium]|jgi:formate/nitrite transporter|nr:formate transporter FocA [Chloroflexota bacterium]